jgi:ketosteroid isomerase-like protein
MSQQNMETIERGYEHFGATRDLLAETIHPDLVWDMSTFSGWPERQTYSGLAGAREFIAEWTDAWDEWELEVEAPLDAGDKVVAIVHQRGRSKATGLTVDMEFAQVWTLRHGKLTRMQMYAERAKALEAAGLSE